MKKRLVLASGSPRRQEMLRFLQIPFELEIPGVSEDWSPGDGAENTARGLALRKARACTKPGVIVAMDTVVAIGSRKLSKPADAAEAKEMLRLLSGKTHRVITGVAIRNGKNEVCRAETTKVEFRKLTESEIHKYIRSGEPFDKAGGYAIQGLARLFIDRIDGCYYNVVGFPVSCFQRCLRELGMTIYDFMKLSV